MFGFGLSKRVKELERELCSIKLSIAVIENEAKLAINQRYLPNYGVYQDGELTCRQAIEKIADHLGLKWQVDPAKPQTISLVKEKKK